jgi:hypothetical protein
MIETLDLLHRVQPVTRKRLFRPFQALVPETGGKGDGGSGKPCPRVKRNKQWLEIPVGAESID